MARDAWKWKEMGKIQKASTAAGRRICKPSLVLVGGVIIQTTENATKTQNTTLNTYGKLSLFILFYILSTFGIKRCKILSFMKHFYRSLESSHERPLRNTVNVWDHMSRCLEQFGWSACGCNVTFCKLKFIKLKLSLYFKFRIAIKQLLWRRIKDGFAVLCVSTFSL